MLKIKNGDFIIVISGKDKGKTGIISKMLLSNNRKMCIIDGINIKKKHVKKDPKKKDSGGILLLEFALDLSNVSIFNKNINKRDKIRFKLLNGNKIRIYKSTGDII